MTGVAQSCYLPLLKAGGNIQVVTTAPECHTLWQGRYAVRQMTFCSFQPALSQCFLTPNLTTLWRPSAARGSVSFFEVKVFLRPSETVYMQVLWACQKGKETVRVAFQELNEAGLMARFLGLRLFMPLSHLARPEPGKFMTHEVSGNHERYKNQRNRSMGRLSPPWIDKQVCSVPAISVLRMCRS